MVDFASYITQYGQSVGLPELKFNEAGICSLTFDDKLAVDIIYHKDVDQCVLVSVVGTLPSENQEECFKQLLISNAYGTENKGSSIGIDESENRIILSHVFIPSIVSFDLFKTLLGNFVTLTQKWQEQYESLLSSLESSEPKESIPNPFEFTRI